MKNIDLIISANKQFQNKNAKFKNLYIRGFLLIILMALVFLHKGPSIYALIPLVFYNIILYSDNIVKNIFNNEELPRASRSTSNLRTLFGIVYLSFFLNCVGFLIFVIPGIVSFVSFSQVFFIFNDNKEMSLVNVYKTSWNTTKGYRSQYFMLFIYYVIAYIIASAPFLLCYLHYLIFKEAILNSMYMLLLPFSLLTTLYFSFFWILPQYEMVKFLFYKHNIQPNLTKTIVNGVL